MFKSRRLALIVYLLVNTVCGFAATNAASPAPVSMPLAFEANRGQTAPQVKYVARSREGILFFTDHGVTVAVPQLGSFRMLFENAAPPQITTEGKLAAKSNYLDHRPGSSIAGIENYGALVYSGLYPGIGVRFYGQGRHLEHDFIVAPGADSHLIALRMEGIDHIALQPSGNLELSLGKANLFETAPVAWQMVNGQRKSVHANWQLLGNNKLGIRLGEYDRTLPVTIDPVLAYSTHLGGATGEDLDLGTSFPADTSISHVGLDANHNIYVSGTTSAVDYPTTAGAFDRTSNIQDVFHEDATSQSGFVSKFDPSGRILLYSTFLRDFVEVMWVDASGHVYSAETGSDDFPGPSDGSDGGMFVDKLSPDGSTLQFTTVFARTPANVPQSCITFTDSRPLGMISDDSGHLYLVGSTQNPCLPATAGKFQATLPNANGSGFVAKFDTTKSPASSLVYSTYLGGSADVSSAQAIAIDGSGNAYIAGITAASNFPHSVAFGTATGNSAFVTKLNATATGALFSTLLKGSDAVSGIAIDSTHSVYFAGRAHSGYPTTAGAFQSTITKAAPTCTDINGNINPCAEGYATKLTSTGNGLVFSTLLGGKNNDTLNGFGINSAGMIFVTGSTNSPNFPTTASAFKRTLPAGATDTFVTAFQPDGKSLNYSTLLGGSHQTVGLAVVVDPAFNAWVVGNTSDADYPVTPNAFQPGLKGHSDGFIAKVVIAGDNRLLMRDNISTVARNGVVTFFAQVTNLGPDSSSNVALTNPIPAGYSFDKIFTQTASSCSTPAVGATTGSVVCKKTALAVGQSFWVNVYLRATAASGANIVNKASVSAQTQDLAGGNNSIALTVHVK